MGLSLMGLSMMGLGTLAQPWVILPSVVVLALLILGVSWWRRRRREPTAIPVANTEALRALPEYQRAVRRHRWQLLGGVGLLAVLLVAAELGAARPTQTTILVSQKDNRDIVLCLDVSGSMIEVDSQVVSTFTSLVQGFKGDRVSLVIFNSSAVPVFPLTDDYTFVTDQLNQAQLALTRLDPRDPFFAGTLNGEGSSLIGDGLATCVRSFDHPELKRARSVILASDNETLGKSLFTLPEAGQLADEDQIQVYGINPSDNPSSTAATEMQSVTESTGGVYFALNDISGVQRVLEGVSSREASRIPSSPRTVVHDSPVLPIGLASLATLAFLGLRRIRWRP